MAERESLCVYCRRRPLDPAWRPFCSDRCRLADLGRWLSEDYRLPAGDAASGPAADTDTPRDPVDDET